MPIDTPPPYKQPGKQNSDTINPEWPAMPANPPASKGAVANVGADAGSQIRPQPAVGVPVPSNPAGGMGAIPNVGSGVEGSVVRGGTDMPTSAGE